MYHQRALGVNVIPLWGQCYRIWNRGNPSFLRKQESSGVRGKGSCLRRNDGFSFFGLMR